jgi:hypothetical protein
MIIVIEVPFVSTPVHIVVGMRFKPLTLKGTKLVSVHVEMPKELNKVFITQPSESRGGSLNPPRPPRPPGCFGLPMVNSGKPPLPLNMPYHRSFNYLEYVKGFDPNVHVRVF